MDAGSGVNRWEEIERRIRERGIRVEERLELLRLLAGESGEADEDALAERREKLLGRVRSAAAKLKESLR